MINELQSQVKEYWERYYEKTVNLQVRINEELNRKYLAY